ncbi:putative reverse transcriptase domain-containing protein, partial [Tanacetum coccineum]
YYQRFVANSSKVAKPLASLTQKIRKYEWVKEQEEAFQTLKDNLCDTLILSFLDGSKEFAVYCDASNQGLGDVRILMIDEAHASRYLVHLMKHQRLKAVKPIQLGCPPSTTARLTSATICLMLHLNRINRCSFHLLYPFLFPLLAGLGLGDGDFGQERCENPPPVTIHTRFERFNKQNPHSFDNAAAPKDAENRISQLEEILMFSRQGWLCISLKATS